VVEDSVGGSVGLSLEAVKLRVLRPPSNELNCVERYAIPTPQKPLYYVCITGDMYVVYDSISTERGLPEVLARVEERLYDVLVGEESIADLLESVRDERVRHIIERQYVGYGVLEAFLQDPNVSPTSTS